MDQLSKIEKLLRKRHWTLWIYTQHETVTVDILDVHDYLVDSFAAPNLIVAFTAIAHYLED